MKNYIIFGAPGAGKGTQAKLLAEKYGLVHISSGEIFRREIETGELGEKIKKCLAAGRLVPDKITNQIMENEISRRREARGLIFDGFPRTLKQAKELDKMLTVIDTSIAAVLKIKITEEEGIKRIIKRAKTSGRSDDNVKVLKERFKIYRQEVKPILAYYQDQRKLIVIDGEGTINKISRDIISELKKLK